MKTNYLVIVLLLVLLATMIGPPLGFLELAVLFMIVVGSIVAWQKRRNSLKSSPVQS